MAQVVVIGAGLGGLASAARLAKLGHTVTVLERRSSVGGLVGRFSRDGHTFDTGPSVFTLPAVYRDLWRKSGRPLERELDLVPVDPSAQIRLTDGTTVSVPNATRAGLAHALDGSFGAGAAQQWDELMTRAAQMWDLVRAPMFESTHPDAAALTPTRATRKTLGVDVSLRDLGRQYLHLDPLRQLLDRYALQSGCDPRRAPAVLATLPYIEQSFGTWRVPGGMHQLALALAERVRFRGAQIRTEAAVAGITTDGSRVSGVLLDSGETLPADIVIANLDPTQTARLLPQSSAGQAHQNAPLSSHLSAGTFVMFLALGPPGSQSNPAPHQRILLGDVDDECDAVFGVTARWPKLARTQRPPSLAANPTIVINAPDDDSLRPSSAHESWVVQVNVPVHDPEHGLTWTSQLADSYADLVLASMARAGIDIRGRLRWRHLRTPADVEADTGHVGGPSYGSAMHGWNSLLHRPAQHTAMPGLYQVGGSIHPGAGLASVGLGAASLATSIGPSVRS